MELNFSESFEIFCFRPENPFWANLVKTINIVSLSWNFVPSLVLIMWYSMMMFINNKYLTINNFLGRNWSKNWNLFVQIRETDYLEMVLEIKALLQNGKLEIDLINWDSHHTRLDSLYEAYNYKKRRRKRWKTYKKIIRKIRNKIGAYWL